MSILKRLKLIETCIELQDHDLIKMQLMTIKGLASEYDCIPTIIELLEKKEYIKAQQEIKKLLQSHHSLLTYEDPEVNTIRLELTAFEKKIQDLLLLRDEARNKLKDFNREYQLTLGPILVKIFAIQKELSAQKLKNELRRYQILYSQFEKSKAVLIDLKKNQTQLYNELNKLNITELKYDEIWSNYIDLRCEINSQEDECEIIRQQAKAEFVNLESNGDFQQYRTAQENSYSFEEDYEEIKNTVVSQLNNEEFKRLKFLYRQACKKCHPDIVSDDLKEQAHEYMVEINAAYAAQDIESLEYLLYQLEHESYLSTSSEKLTGKESLIAKLSELKDRYQHISEEFSEIGQSEDYKIIQGLGDDWSGFFDVQKQELEELLQSLECSFNEIDHSKNSDYDIDKFFHKMGV